MRSAPMPLVCRREPSIWPNMMPTIERIIATSIATARMLMAERKGRCSRLPMTNLFMLFA